MKVLFCITILMLIVTPARAWFDPWTKTDYALQGILLVLDVMDYNQTMQFTQKKTHYEDNKLLGEYPSRSRVNNYFLGLAVLHVAVAMTLPKPYRTMWQGTFIGIEGYCVRHNYRAGIRVSF